MRKNKIIDFVLNMSSILIFLLKEDSERLRLKCNLQLDKIKELEKVNEKSEEKTNE